MRCFKPPEGRIFFYVFEKPKKNTAAESARPRAQNLRDRIHENKSPHAPSRNPTDPTLSHSHDVRRGLRRGEGWVEPKVGIGYIRNITGEITFNPPIRNFWPDFLSGVLLFP